MTKDEKWARALLKGIEKKKESARRDQRANPLYWNGDDWGSISGIRDAREWMEGEIIKYILKRVTRKRTLAGAKTRK